MDGMVELGDVRFGWREWDARVLGDETEWTHPGVAALPGGGIVVFDQTQRELVRLGDDGRVLERDPVPAGCLHGLTATSEGAIWAADTGRRDRVVDGVVVRDESPGTVTRLGPPGGADGPMPLPRPAHPAYDHDPYVPTSVAVAEPAVGGSGDIWVADGYGASLVHRYGADGEHIGSLDGTEGAGRFDRPHAVAIDARGAEPRLLVTDRSNHRIATYDLDGRFIGLLDHGALRMPSAIAVAGDLLVIVELWSRLAVFDPDDRLVGYLGDGEVAWEEEAWPNRLEGDRIERRDVHVGRFNAPHGIGARPDGSLVVAEWSLGGRLVELAPLT